MEEIDEGKFNYYLALVDLVESDYSGAAERFENFMDNSPYLTYWENSVYAFQAVKLYLSLFEEYGEDIPGVEELSDTAWALAGEDDFAGAIPYYYLLTLMAPDDPVFHYQLGFCFESLDMHYLALTSYSMHLYFEPESDDIDYIHDYFDSRRLPDE